VNRFGVTAFDGLPTVRFAIPKNLPNRTRVIIGVDDELFFGDQYPALFAKLQPRIGVQVVPGADHMGVTVEDKPVAEIARTAREMLGTGGAERCAP
jgi:hypothetical protein